MEDFLQFSDQVPFFNHGKPLISLGYQFKTNTIALPISDTLLAFN